jgi:hypothetical protein
VSARAIGAAFVSCALAIACGKFLEQSGDPSRAAVDGGAPDATAGDVTTAEGSTGTAARPPPDCPLIDCPSAEEECKDEACEEQGSQDFVKVGDVKAANGVCTVTAPAPAVTYLERTLPRTRKRTNVTLSVTLTAATDAEGTLMMIAIAGAPTGERIVVERRAGALVLCERNAGAGSCAAPLMAPIPVTLHLWGVLTSDNPPKATFALGTDDCDAARVIDVTQPFEQGDITGRVGCVDMPSGCSIQLTDALLLLRDE